MGTMAIVLILPMDLSLLLLPLSLAAKSLISQEWAGATPGDTEGQRPEGECPVTVISGDGSGHNHGIPECQGF